MKTTRLAALRAKPISWVTTIMVMPCRARSTITSSTSLTISGSSAEVGSSNRITFGSMASARAMATRCCWPPDSCAGYLSAWDSTPTRLSSSMPALVGLGRRLLAHLDRAEGDVLQDRLVGEEVEGLEHHPDVGSQLGQRLALLGQLLPVDGDRARLDGLQPVDRPAQGGLARARRPEHHHDLALVDGEVDVLQHVQVAEVLVDVGQHDQRFADRPRRHGGTGGVVRRSVQPDRPIGDSSCPRAVPSWPDPRRRVAANGGTSVLRFGYVSTFVAVVVAIATLSSVDSPSAPTNSSSGASTDQVVMGRARVEGVRSAGHRLDRDRPVAVGAAGEDLHPAQTPRRPTARS